MDAPGASSFLDLEDDVIASILSRLSPGQRLHIAAVCRRLKALAYAEHAWSIICHDWMRKQPHSASVELAAWLSDAAFAGTSSWLTRRPATYRELWPVLQQHAAYLGVWQGTGVEGVAAKARGAVYHSIWGRDCVVVQQLNSSTSFTMDMSSSVFCQLGPAQPGWSGEVLDDTHCLLREQRSSPVRSPTLHMAAASAVALGSSPPGSFSDEFSRFMLGSVEARGRRSKRSSSGTGGQPALHHLVRLRLPRASNQHPLCGLWKGLYGPHGLELVAIQYDCSGSSARIVCTKLTGDTNVPAGQVTWQAEARQLGLEDEQEARLVGSRHALAAMMQQVQQHWAAEAGDGGQPAPAAAQPAAADGPSDGSSEPGEHDGPVRVVAAHRGQGQIAGTGFEHPSWVDGRLWVYSNQRCGFLWLDHMMLIDYERVDLR